MPIKVETDEEYHAGEGVSKSKLWTLDNKTPFHARFGARKETNAFAIGKAAHCAILEPEDLENRYTKGPDARRNSNEWKHAEDFARHAGTTLLKPDDYDMAMVIRDMAATVPELELMRQGGCTVETSAYHLDEETQTLVKTRPDIYNPTHRLIGDIKNMADASPEAFKRDVGKFGYHMQHALYSEVWAAGAEMPVDGFFFIVFEKSDPPLVAVYELSAAAIAEGYARYRSALARYAECVRTDTWPGYPEGVQQIGLRYYDYKLTPPPKEEEGQFAEDDDAGEDEAEVAADGE
jgi:exodeoxyribonuclease VIII